MLIKMTIPYVISAFAQSKYKNKKKGIALKKIIDCVKLQWTGIN